MLLELINSIFVTFMATEFLVVKNSDTSISSSSNQHRRLHFRLFSRYIDRFSRPLQFLTLIVALLNLFVHFHDSGVAISNWIKAHVGVLHIPRIVAAIFTFLTALWWDCRRIVNSSNKTSWSNDNFLRQLVKSFCRMIPMYPFAAVVISFIFLFVITLFEDLHINTVILNGPIYYFTLYGPLMLIYWDCKKCIINAEILLPL
jgi:hypothetical protein